MIENFHSKTRCSVFVSVKKYMARWKNIKTHPRSVIKRTVSGQAAGKQRTYIYTGQLSFLQTSVRVAETYSSIMKESVTNDSSENMEIEETH